MTFMNFSNGVLKLFIQNNIYKNPSKSLITFILYFLLPYKKFLYIPILFSWILALEISCTPYLLKIIVNRLIKINNIKESYTILATPVFLYIATKEILNWAFRLYDWFKIKVIVEIKSNIYEYILNQINQQSYIFFQRNLTGSIVNKINDITSGIETLFSMFVMIFMWRFLVLTIAFIMIYQVHFSFTLLIFFWGIMILYITLKHSNLSSSYSQNYSEERSILMGKFSDLIYNIINTKLFPNISFEQKRLKPLLEEVVQKERQLLWFIFKLSIFQGTSVTVLVAGLMILLVKNFQENQITVGDFVLILGLSGSIIPMIFTLSDQISQFFKNIGCCKQALKIISAPQESIDEAGTNSLIVTNGEIIFQDVCFRYNNENFLFKKLNLTFQSGKKTGLIGSSGAGKTTLIYLLLRLYNIQVGSIFIDDQNINTVTRESLRSQITVVPQEPILFNRTILENIGFGNPNATENQIMQASKQAQSHDFIMLLKNGYQTSIGEKGLILSAGQKQRIAIARAILKDAPIVIMDEPTSALDSITEYYMQQSLDALFKNRTTIVIAHRLSTLQSMDRIILLERGVVVGDDSFEHLKEKNLYFKEFLNKQTV